MLSVSQKINSGGKHFFHVMILWMSCLNKLCHLQMCSSVCTHYSQLVLAARLQVFYWLIFILFPWENLFKSSNLGNIKCQVKLHLPLCSFNWIWHNNASAHPFEVVFIEYIRTEIVLIIDLSMPRSAPPAWWTILNTSYLPEQVCWILNKVG